MTLTRKRRHIPTPGCFESNVTILKAQKDIQTQQEWVVMNKNALQLEIITFIQFFSYHYRLNSRDHE